VGRLYGTPNGERTNRLLRGAKSLHQKGEETEERQAQYKRSMEEKIDLICVSYQHLGKAICRCLMPQESDASAVKGVRISRLIACARRITILFTG